MASKKRSSGRFWVAIVVGFLLVEIGYRAFLFQTYAIDLKFTVATVDKVNSPGLIYAHGNVYGSQPLNADTTWTRFDVNGKQYSKFQVHSNNLGWVSHSDYTIEKPAGEFRIALIGDSMTLSINNALPWPDFVRDNLNADKQLLSALGADHIEVLNISAAGASLPLMANALTDIAKRLDADVAVVNFPIDAVPRRGPQIVPVAKRDFSYTESPNPPVFPPAEINIDGVEIRLYDCEPRELSNPDCRVNPSWTVPTASFGESDIAKVKKELAFRLIWARVVTSWKPLALLDILGMPIIPRAQAAEYTDEVMTAVDSFSTVREVFPITLITCNPVYWDLIDAPTRVPSEERLASLIKAAAERGMVVVDMRAYMPLDGGEPEWKKWYNVPVDGHFSDYGASIYGKAMAQMIRERLIEGAVSG